MLFVDVEGEVSAASMVKDSKIYVEIAKFVQAYEAIVQDPNKFLTDINERPIDEETEVLTWEQFVKIATTCELGFNPKPDEATLVVYYSYAMQIGSISREAKRIATINDIAEAQKKYYNFIDDTTVIVENQYNKQHEIASRRAREAQEVESAISKKKLKIVGSSLGMAFGVLLCGLGLFGMFFEQLKIVKFIGFGNRFIGGIILMIIGFAIFFFLDRMFVKFRRDYLSYKDDTKNIISRSERTTNDELVLKDKLDKYKEDLKIAKYELADKNKNYDVTACIERLRGKNKYFQNMLESEGAFNRKGIFKDRGLDDLPLKFKLGDKIDDVMGMKKATLIAETSETMRDMGGKGFINTESFNSAFVGENDKYLKDRLSEREGFGSDKTFKGRQETEERRENQTRHDPNSFGANNGNNLNGNTMDGFNNKQAMTPTPDQIIATQPKETVEERPREDIQRDINEIKESREKLDSSLKDQEDRVRRDVENKQVINEQKREENLRKQEEIKRAMEAKKLEDARKAEEAKKLAEELDSLQRQ